MEAGGRQTDEGLSEHSGQHLLLDSLAKFGGDNEENAVVKDFFRFMALGTKLRNLKS